MCSYKKGKCVPFVTPQIIGRMLGSPHDSAAATRQARKVDEKQEIRRYQIWQWNEKVIRH